MNPVESNSRRAPARAPAMPLPHAMPFLRDLSLPSPARSGNHLPGFLQIGHRGGVPRIGREPRLKRAFLLSRQTAITPREPLRGGLLDLRLGRTTRI